MTLHDECNELLGEEDLEEKKEKIFTFKGKIHIWLKCAEEEQQRYAMSKRADLQKCHLAKAADIAVNEMLPECQEEAVSLETPRQEQWRRKQKLLNF